MLKQNLYTIRLLNVYYEQLAIYCPHERIKCTHAARVLQTIIDSKVITEDQFCDVARMAEQILDALKAEIELNPESEQIPSITEALARAKATLSDITNILPFYIPDEIALARKHIEKFRPYLDNHSRIITALIALFDPMSSYLYESEHHLLAQDVYDVYSMLKKLQH